MISIIDSGGANIASIQFALKRLGCDSVLTTDHDIIQSSSHVILPGVGKADYAMQRLKSLSLDTLIPQLQQPVLGICLGMQLLFEYSAESNVNCLGIIKDHVQRLPDQPGLTIPHMGWNKLKITAKNNPLLQHIADEEYCYFVHSFAVPVTTTTLAVTTHGIDFSALVNRQNFYGTQFHPERSQRVGRQILSNFIGLKKS